MDATALERELRRLEERHAAQPGGRSFAALADLYRKLGRYAEARDHLDAGLKLHPTYGAAHVILGRLHRDLGEPEPALAAFERVLELDPFNLVARRHCATLCEELGRVDAAVEHWRQLQAADPSGEEAELALARLAPADDEPDESASEEPRSEPAPVEPEPEAARADSAPAPAEPVALQADLDPDDEPAPARPVKAAKTDEGIVTVTLARIYREQGFAAKALRIYEQLLEAGHDPELRAAADELRAELAADRPGQRPVEGDELLDSAEAPGDEAPARPAAPRPQPPQDEAPALVAPAEALDEEESNRDYSRFRAWLGEIHEKP